MTISSHLPDIVDAYIFTRTQRLALDKQVKEVKEHEDMLKDAIISKYKEANINTLGSTNGIVKLTITKEPEATDWPALYAYIQQTGDFSLLHKRVTAAAVKEQTDAGMTLPGIGWYDVPKLSVSAAPKSPITRS